MKRWEGIVEKSNLSKLKRKLRGADPKHEKPKGHKQKRFDSKALRTLLKREGVYYEEHT